MPRLRLLRVLVPQHPPHVQLKGLREAVQREEDSPLGLDKWLPAIWLIANTKDGTSSHELGRALGVTQRTAWFMLHRIRKAMETGTFEKLKDTVEVDETFVGLNAIKLKCKI